MSEEQTLIERLEKAAGPDRSLERAIADVVGSVTPYRGFPGDEPTGVVNFPHYTSSLDAAMTLVPEGYEWSLTWEAEIARAEIGDPLLLMEGEAATPAIAICIAALKARATP